MADVKGVRPILRWVGGKVRLVGRLSLYVPDLSEATYVEPFVGAGSLYFATKPARAVLADKNADLIECYKQVRDAPELVWRYLRGLIPRQTRKEYYALRDEFNRCRTSGRRAALFIYLNKTCFNGIWRVNREGVFNVPYGAKEKAGFPSRTELIATSEALAGAHLMSGDFELAASLAKSGDFVYLDPPYLPLSATAFFRHYTSARFTTEDHERVALVAADLVGRGVNVMITEGESNLVRKWYREFFVSEVCVRRSVSCDAVRADARELIITSYSPRT